jgi:hypothetical protein
VVGFYDARDLPACAGSLGPLTGTLGPLTGTLGPLTGTASVSGDGWVMHDACMVGFKRSDGDSLAARTLLQIGGGSECWARQVSATGLQFSGCANHAAEIAVSGTQQIASSLVCAAVRTGGSSARSYCNGGCFSRITSAAWKTADSPWYLGRSAAAAADRILPGGVRFVLLLNRALTPSEVAAVARWRCAGWGWT